MTLKVSPRGIVLNDSGTNELIENISIYRWVTGSIWVGECRRAPHLLTSPPRLSWCLAGRRGLMETKSGGRKVVAKLKQAKFSVHLSRVRKDVTSLEVLCVQTAESQPGAPWSPVSLLTVFGNRNAKGLG